MNDGWIALHRKIYSSTDFKNQLETSIFIYLLTMASHKPVQVIYRKKKITLNRGDISIAYRDLAKKFNISREMQDEFAVKSQAKAAAAQKNRRFKNEIVPIEIQIKKETKIFGISAGWSSRYKSLNHGRTKFYSTRRGSIKG